MNTRTRSIEQQAACAILRSILAPGDTVYGLVRHVARSGMSRTIDFYAAQDGGLRYLSGYVATALDYRRADSGALKVSGCGTDMIFHTVYNLGSVLWPDGFTCTGDTSERRCRSNDHSNGDRDYTPHPHRSGGYALRSEQM